MGNIIFFPDISLDATYRTRLEEEYPAADPDETALQLIMILERMLKSDRITFTKRSIQMMMRADMPITQKEIEIALDAMNLSPVLKDYMSGIGKQMHVATDGTYMMLPAERREARQSQLNRYSKNGSSI